MEVMKCCKDCGEEKPLNEFYKNTPMKDGYLNSCKTCRKEYSRSEAGRAAQRRHLESDKGRQTRYIGHKRWCDDNKLKRKAHHLISNGIRDGKIVRGTTCEDCGATEHLHAHHDDYAKPVEVRWLCPICHKSWHKEHGRGLDKAMSPTPMSSS